MAPPLIRRASYLAEEAEHSNQTQVGDGSGSGRLEELGYGLGGGDSLPAALMRGKSYDPSMAAVGGARGDSSASGLGGGRRRAGSGSATDIGQKLPVVGPPRLMRSKSDGSGEVGERKKSSFRGMERSDGLDLALVDGRYSRLIDTPSKALVKLVRAASTIGDFDGTGRTLGLRTANVRMSAPLLRNNAGAGGQAELSLEADSAASGAA